LGIPVIEDISHSFGNNIKIAEKNENENQALNSAEEAGAKDREGCGEKASGVFSILGLEERDMLTSGGGALLFAMNKRDGSLLKSYSGLADEYCLPDINAALAVVQFKEIQRNISKRRDISINYTQASLRTRHKRFIPLSDNENNCYSFSLILETGLKDVIAYARKKEIAVESALENSIANTGLCENCPVSNSLVLRTVLFPLYPRLRPYDVDRVSRLITTLP
jgi:dTDP-4-amino-4,6-dideoxygalactose transaminase